MEHFSPIANGVGLICLAAGILVALYVLRTRSDSGGPNLVTGFLKVAAIVMLIGGAIFVSVMLLLVFSVPFWVLMAIIVLMALNRLYRNQRQSLLNMLALATERQMPLTPAVEAFSKDGMRIFGPGMSKLTEALDAGLPLAQALRTTRGTVPPMVLPAVQVGEATGTLSQTLRQASRPTESNQALQQLLTQTFYLGNIVFFGSFILAFIMIKIAPPIQMIMLDFSQPLPPMTDLLFSLSRELVGFSALSSLMLPPLALVVVFATIHYLGWIDWEPPLLNRVLRAVDMAAILRLLAIVVEAKRPLFVGIDTLAQSYPRPWIRNRLERVALDVSQGRDWCEAFREHRLIRDADAAILSSAQRVGNLPWAMRLVADSGERRLAYRVRAWLQVVAPVLLLLLGAAVCFLITALFLPLITIIENLAV